MPRSRTMIWGIIGLAIATFLVLAGSLLLWLSGFSTPFIRSIYYLAPNGASGDRLGTFGYCKSTLCLPHQVGYVYPLVPNSNSLTGSLILTPIAAGIGSLGFISLLCTFRFKKLASVSFTLICFAAFLALLSYILALSAFVSAYRRYSSINTRPHYGPAMWMHLTGMLVFLVALPFTLLGWMKLRSNDDDYRYGSDANSNVTYNSTSHLKKARQGSSAHGHGNGLDHENDQTVMYLDNNDNNNRQNLNPNQNQSLNPNQNLNQNRQDMTHVPTYVDATTPTVVSTPASNPSGTLQAHQTSAGGVVPNANAYQPVAYSNANPYPNQNSVLYPNPHPSTGGGTGVGVYQNEGWDQNATRKM